MTAQNYGHHAQLHAYNQALMDNVQIQAHAGQEQEIFYQEVYAQAQEQKRC
jgi:hypothetical protein